MKTSDFNYSYDPSQVAVEPSDDFRTMLSTADGCQELQKEEIFELFNSGDVLVLNDSKVVKRRVFSEEGFEILFLKDLGVCPDQEGFLWEVLFPASRLKKNQSLTLPDGVSFKLYKKGLPQTVLVSKQLDAFYFEAHGEMALPPYIQKARDERHNSKEDDRWYQTAWAKESGSCAAPTASLHFTQEDLDQLKEKGVEVCYVTLHVGLGTFLPVKSESLLEHKMHHEEVFIDAQTVATINGAKAKGQRVFGLGTTVTRTLEAWKKDHFQQNQDGSLQGATDLFIYPGFDFQVVDVLMTNFHQPESTLLALVSGFAGYERVMEHYKWAVQNKFRLFSYGDFSIWMK